MYDYRGLHQQMHKKSSLQVDGAVTQDMSAMSQEKLIEVYLFQLSS